MKYTKAFYKEAGSRGGKATVSKYGKKYMKRIARRGGKRTKRK